MTIEYRSAEGTVHINDGAKTTERYIRITCTIWSVTSIVWLLNAEPVE